VRGSVTEIYRLFDGQSRTLHIPVYQRNYDWSAKQCSRLFDDLEAIILKDRPKHFFGAVVGNPVSSFEWVVIDGQQRLTTVSLLILALSRSAESGAVTFEDPELPTKIRKNYLLLEEGVGDVKVKLKPVKDDNLAYQRLFGPPSEFIETSRLTANYRYFLDRLQQTSLTGDQVWDAICRLEVMELNLEAHDEPQRIFESLNSTGLALSEGDKIRNLVLMDLNPREQKRLYEGYWNPVEKLVHHRTDWFIRWFLVTMTGKTPNQHEVYDAFKRYLASSDSHIEDTLSTMLTYSRHVREIEDASTGLAKVDVRLRRFNAIKGDVVFPYLIPLLQEVRDETTTQDDLAEVLRILESYVYRRVTCGIAANALNKIFATLYNEARRLRGHDHSHAEVLTYLLMRREGGGRFPDDDEFVAAFASRNSYSLRPVYRRYLFDCLENRDSRDVRDVAAALDTGSASIEHIMPQTLTDAWRSSLGEDANEIHQTWRDRIGNLTVTGYNSKYSNASFGRKKEMDEGFDDSPYRLNSYLKTLNTWGLPQLEERTRQLTEIARTYWAMPHTSFRPPAAILDKQALGDDTEFRGRAITAYEFGDVHETVASWAEMIRRLLRVLLEHHRNELFEYAQGNTNFEVADNSRTLPGRPFDKVDESMAVLTGSSTGAKMRLLRDLFAHLDLDTEDLVFTLRPEKTSDSTSAKEVEESRTPSPFASITKFLVQIDELAEQQLRPEDTIGLQSEFKREFERFYSKNPSEDLGEFGLSEFSNKDIVAAATASQLLAAVTATIEMTSLFDPQALHNVIADGTMSLWLDRLDKIG